MPEDARSTAEPCLLTPDGVGENCLEHGLSFDRACEPCRSRGWPSAAAPAPISPRHRARDLTTPHRTGEYFEGFGPASADADTETALKVLADLSSRTSDGRLRDAIATVRSALWDEVES